MKRLRFFFLLVALLLGILALGYYGYITTRQARLLKQARGYLANSNPSTALLCLRRALGYNPDDLEANRLMAELAERASSPAALLWRSRVVERNPKSTPDRIALAETALMFGDHLSATNALEGISKSGKQTAAFHNAAGNVAVATHHFAEAESHFQEACRLEPTNVAPQMNLAVVRLQGTNENALAEARFALTLLRTNPVVRCQALRELTADSLRHQEPQEALGFSAELLRETNHVFSDELLRLDVLRVGTEKVFKQALAVAQGDAAKDSRKLYELVTWQAATVGPAEALKWLQSLPPVTQTNQPAALLEAKCRAALQDWRELHALLESQYWAELEPIRHAYQSLALHGQDLVASAAIEWQKALDAAGNRKEAIVMLFRFATEWNWTGQAEELVWTLIRNYPGEKWATVALTRTLLTEGRTRSLMVFYNQQATANPSDLSARNNLAMTALLLNAWELRPHDLARDVYRKAPANPAYASTYALSLHLQEKNENALQVLQKLAPPQLEDPGIAACYGVVLQATGHAEQARRYLDLASKGRLLPEERKLVWEARASAQSASFVHVAHGKS